MTIHNLSDFVYWDDIDHKNAQTFDIDELRNVTRDTKTAQTNPAMINKAIFILESLIPSEKYMGRPTKLHVLDDAADYIQELVKRNAELEAKLESALSGNEQTSAKLSKPQSKQLEAIIEQELDACKKAILGAILSPEENVHVKSE